MAGHYTTPVLVPSPLPFPPVSGEPEGHLDRTPAGRSDTGTDVRGRRPVDTTIRCSDYRFYGSTLGPRSDQDYPTVRDGRGSSHWRHYPDGERLWDLRTPQQCSLYPPVPGP